jgi:hypothetical protein
MRKKEQETFQFAEIVQIPVSQQKVYWGIRYMKNPKTKEWSVYRLSCSCLKTMKKLVENWNAEIDSVGIFKGEIKGNVYPELPAYEDK